LPFLMGFLCSLSVAEDSYRFERMYPILQQPWYFAFPSSITLSEDEFIFVSDLVNRRLIKMTKGKNELISKL